MTPQPQDADEFRLDVEISGLCLYVWDETRRSIRLVMPDARLKQRARGKHPDQTPASPHVGYLRFDLGNLVPEVAGLAVAERDDSPAYEVVHRFNRETLDLGIPDDGGEIGGSLMVPDFREFAPVLEPIPGLADSVPPEVVLMRTQLSGGEFRTVQDATTWDIPGNLHPDGKPLLDRVLGGEVHWSRRIRARELRLRVAGFGSGAVVEIPLRPTLAEGDVEPSIQLKLANLCANPLEWAELESPDAARPDEDFKWLYHLFRRRGGVDQQRFPSRVLPVPVPILGGTVHHGDVQDCFSGQT